MEQVTEKTPLNSTQDVPQQGAGCQKHKNSSAQVVKSSNLSFVVFIMLIMFSVYVGQSDFIPFVKDMVNEYSRSESAYKMISTKLSATFNQYLSSWNRVPCSGHGVVGSMGSCVCEVGWAGSDCDLVESLAAFNAKKDPTVKHLLLVTDSFGPLQPETEISNFYVQLSQHISKAKTDEGGSFKVTVLYTGAWHPFFDKYSNSLQEYGVDIERLEHSGVQIGKSETVQTSYDVYQWLRSRPGKYDIVQFTASSGNGYFTLRAHRQGLVCFNTKFVVLLDKITKSVEERLEARHSEHVVTNVDILKLDYMQQKTVELADAVIVASQSMIDFASNAGWELPPETHMIKYITSVSNPKRVASRAWRMKPKELLFIGPLNHVRGLPIFADALDKLVEASQKADSSLPKFRVRFMGSSDVISGMSSEDYLELRSIQWGDLDWRLELTTDFNKTLEYARQPKSGRVVVLPNIIDPTALYTQEVLYAGAPVITSDLHTSWEAIHPEDRSDILFQANNTKALVKKLESVLLNGTIVARPSAEWSDALDQWINVYSSPTDAEENCLLMSGASGHEEPLVSIVIVHHNRPHLLRLAVESIERQTYKNIEVVLVDDGSTDAESVAYLNELAWKWWETKGWRVLRKSNQYLGAARNTGVENARGKYILFMDDDDYAKPHQVETLVRIALQTNADVVTSGHDLFGGKGSPTTTTSGRFIPLGGARLVGMLENVFGDASMFVRRDFFVDMGGFTEDYGVGFEDYEFLAKVILKGHHLEAIPEALHWYRIHQNSMSSHTDLKANQARFLRPYVDAHNEADTAQRGLLEYTRKKFFARDTTLLPFQTDQDNSTIPVPPPDVCTDQGQIYVPECGKCYYFKPMIDCAGICSDDPNYGHKKDCLGVCQPPNAALPPIDACGVCNGDNSTCTDCRGVVNGPARRDSCGVCAGDGSSCFTLSKLLPSAVPDTGSAKFLLEGAGFTETVVVFVNFEPIPAENYKFFEGNTTMMEVTLSKRYITDGTDDIDVPVYLFNLKDTTNTLMLKLYNPLSNISSISGTKFYVREPATLYITGNNLINADDSLCVFEERTTGNVTTTPVSFVDSTQLSCAVPVISLSQQVLFNLVYGGYVNSDYFVPVAATSVAVTSTSASTKGIILRFFERAPKPTTVVYADNGAFITIRFDKATNANLSQTVCGSYFLEDTSDTTVSILRDEADDDCTAAFVAPDEMHVYVQAKFAAQRPLLAPRPGLYLKFRPSVIGTRDAEFSDATSGKVRISRPVSGISPELSVTAATRIGRCSNFKIDLSQSSGSAGRPFTMLEINVDVDSSYSISNQTVLSQLYASSGPFSLVTLRNYLEQVATQAVVEGYYVFSVPGSQLALDVPYQFNFTLYNFLQKSTTAWWTVTRVTEDIPLITLDGPSKMQRSEVLTLTAVIDQSSMCQSISPSKIRWVHLSGGNTLLDLGNTDINILRIPPYTLDLNAVYTLGSIISIGSGEINVNFSMQIIPGELNARIRGGSRKVSSGASWILEGFIEDSSYLPSEIISEDYEFSWSCFTFDGDWCINVQTGLRLWLPDQQVITVDKGVLKPGQYLFIVQITDPKTNRTVLSPYVNIEVSDGLFPLVSVFTSEQNPSWDSETFKFEASVEPSSVGSSRSLIYEWQTFKDCGKNYFFPVQLSRGITRTELSSSKLKFRPYVLKPGRRYCIGVQVTDKTNGAVGYARLSLGVQMIPSLGFCKTVGNSTGMAWADRFTVQCIGWVGQKTRSLRYTYAARKSDREQPFFIGDRRSQLSTVMGPGTFDIAVLVSDTKGNIAENAPELAFASQDAGISFQDAWARLRAAFTSSLDERQKLQAISILAFYLRNMHLSTGLVKRDINSQTQDAVRADSFALIQGVMNQLYLEPEQVGPYLNQLMGTLTSGGISSASLQATALDILQNIIASVNQNTVDYCFRSNDSIRYLSNLDHVMGSVTNKSVLSSIPVLFDGLQNCVTTTLTCGEDPFMGETDLTSMHVGLVDASSNQNSFCGFDIPNMNKAAILGSNDQCLKYRCGRNLVNYISIDAKATGNGQFTAIDDRVYSLVLKNTSNAVLQPGADVKFAMQYSQNLYSRVNGSSAEKGLCTFYDRTIGKYSSSGCLTTGSNGTHVFCSCDHLTEFAIAISSTSSSKSKDNTIWYIIIGILGLLALIGVIIGGVIIRKRIIRQRNLDKLRVTPVAGQGEIEMILPPQVNQQPAVTEVVPPLVKILDAQVVSSIENLARPVPAPIVPKPTPVKTRPPRKAKLPIVTAPAPAPEPSKASKSQKPPKVPPPTKALRPSATKPGRVTPEPVAAEVPSQEPVAAEVPSQEIVESPIFQLADDERRRLGNVVRLLHDQLMTEVSELVDLDGDIVPAYPSKERAEEEEDKTHIEDVLLAQEILETAGRSVAPKRKTVEEERLEQLLLEQEIVEQFGEPQEEVEEAFQKPVIQPIAPRIVDEHVDEGEREKLNDILFKMDLMEDATPSQSDDALASRKSAVPASPTRELPFKPIAAFEGDDGASREGGEPNERLRSLLQEMDDAHDEDSVAEPDVTSALEGGSRQQQLRRLRTELSSQLEELTRNGNPVPELELGHLLAQLRQTENMSPNENLRNAAENIGAGLRGILQALDKDAEEEEE